MKVILVFILSFTCAIIHAQYSQQRYPIIPKPQTLLPFSGDFPISNKVTIVPDNKLLKKECEFFREQAKQLFNLDLRYGKLSGFEPCIFISLDSSGLPAEGYELFVSRDGINLYGNRAGIFYGLQTILQLIQNGSEPASLVVPSCSIIDYPRFSWRGMHLDVSRHFFPKEDVKNYLRWMAMYKLNTFHWHLTDDQGWRIEIKQYPKLTSVGAWRRGTLIGHSRETPEVYDSIPHSGFYTQEEVKEIVLLADSLHITVVPEIEMPGHACAMIAAYPELGNINPDGHREGCEVQRKWGVMTQVLSPEESTFTFLENVLTEVVALFPGTYVHIGGDECPKEEWKNSPFCQELIRKNALVDEHGLQSWFIQRIVNFLATKGKKTIGWDEILEGGLAEGAAVMSWRGEEGGIAAAKAGHNVVMTPGAFCYFDKYQSNSANEPLTIGGFLPIEKVYSYDPVPASLNADEKKFIMGVQANLWTEYIQNKTQLEYMVFPRIAALSEIAWSRTDIKDFRSLVPRVTTHMSLYDKMKLNYSRALFEITSRYESSPDGKGILLHLSTYSLLGEIKFTRGGVEMDYRADLYTGPILVSGKETIFAAVYDGRERISPFFSQTFVANDALGKTVTLRKQPAKAYNTGGAQTLTDGITGRTPWTGSEWLGWWGDTLDAVIDLGKSDTIRSVKLVTLRDEGSWIYAPSRFQVYLSENGTDYTLAPDESILKASGDFSVLFLKKRTARYIRIVAVPHGTIPEGKEGAGYPAWLFVSEVIVD